MSVKKTIIKITTACAAYFGMVFAVGFLLGTVRVTWAVPCIGKRFSELIEIPVMLAAIFFAAQFTVHRIARGLRPSSLFVVGCVSLCLMLLVEFTVVLSVRGLTLAEYIAHRDPVSGAVYAASLGLFAVMPLLVSIRAGRGKKNARHDGT